MFVLESVWHLPAPADRVWSVLAAPRFSWPDWWPGLTASETRSVVGSAGLAAPGTWARLRVRSPLGYALRFRLRLTETTAPSDGEPGHALLDVTGDLTGRADVTVSETVLEGAVSGGAVSEGAVSEGAVSEGAVSEGAVSGGAVSTAVRLVWAVAPGPAWFRVASRIAPGLLAWAHAHVMRAGERGLAAHLRA